jgi:hypothetical protein
MYVPVAIFRRIGILIISLMLALIGIRAPLVKEIINSCSALFAKNKLDGNVNLIQVLVNPYVYSNNGEFTNIISEHLEPLCDSKI